MNPYVETMGQLIQMLLSEYRLSPDQLAEQSGRNRSYIYYLRNSEVEIQKCPFWTIASLAQAVRLSPADLYLRAGIDVFAVPKMQERLEYENLRLSPLVSMTEVKGDVRLQQAINSAIWARRNYYYEGKLESATAALERAFKSASAAKAERLVTYLRIYLSHLYEMTGNMLCSQDMCREAEAEALEIQREGQARNDKDLEWLGTKLNAQARVRRLWLDHWARGVSEDSLTTGIALIQELEDSNVPQEIPNVFYFLARCAIALARFDDALSYMRTGQAHVLALQNSRLTPFELFLDTGISTESGQPMYAWKEDQLIAATADILLCAGHPEKAWKEYAKVKDHRRPRLS